MQPYKPHNYLSSFGRNRGRSLSERQQWLLDNLLPTLQPDMAEFPAYSRVVLEIGFGAGEHLAALARAHPDWLCIGCEPYINGVAKLLVAIEEYAIHNIRLFTNDARELIVQLPPSSIASAYILFPDPWPKVRHQKRRLVNQHTLSLLAHCQPDGGTLLLATDHVDYATWMLEEIEASPDYIWTAQEPVSWLCPPAEWTQTKYQRKTTEQGRQPLFFHCQRQKRLPISAI